MRWTWWAVGRGWARLGVSAFPSVHRGFGLQVLVLHSVALSMSRHYCWRQAQGRRPEMTFLFMCQSLVPGERNPGHI